MNPNPVVKMLRVAAPATSLRLQPVSAAMGLSSTPKATRTPLNAINTTVATASVHQARCTARTLGSRILGEAAIGGSCSGARDALALLMADYTMQAPGRAVGPMRYTVTHISLPARRV